MIILQNSGSSQTINFIPRSWTDGSTYSVQIYNEMTNTLVYEDLSATFTESDYYNQYTATFTGLIEDVMYNIVIKDGSDVIFKDKMFCTNQAVSSYSVNNDAYTEHDTENEFILL